MRPVRMTGFINLFWIAFLNQPSIAYFQTLAYQKDLLPSKSCDFYGYFKRKEKSYQTGYIS